MIDLGLGDLVGHCGALHTEHDLPLFHDIETRLQAANAYSCFEDIQSASLTLLYFMMALIIFKMTAIHDNSRSANRSIIIVKCNYASSISHGQSMQLKPFYNSLPTMIQG
nr:uncharacterized protein LOC127321510 isoform X2 [Lolium perenne]